MRCSCSGSTARRRRRRCRRCRRSRGGDCTSSSSARGSAGWSRRTNSNRRAISSPCSRRATASAAGRGRSATATRSRWIGEATQTAKFSDGIYMNAGPARIPELPHRAARLLRQVRRPARGRGQFQPLGVHHGQGRVAHPPACRGQRPSRPHRRTADQGAQPGVARPPRSAPSDKAKLLPLPRSSTATSKPDGGFKGTARSGLGHAAGGRGDLRRGRDARCRSNNCWPTSSCH